jgi:hypothetical protein
MLWADLPENLESMIEENSESRDVCNHPRVEIDAWGERLRGCIQCNQWMNFDGEWKRLPERTLQRCEDWIGGGPTHSKAVRPCTHKSRLEGSGWSLSALPSKADIRQRIEHVCFVPLADIMVSRSRGSSPL